jgi:hypothetical protein
LVDAISVETGVGPECRKKHGFNDAQKDPNWAEVKKLMPSIDGETREEAHRAANILIYRIAVEQTGEMVAIMVATVAALGYIKLAERMAARISGKLSVIREGDKLLVKTPYNEGMIANLRAFGGRWDKEKKIWEVSTERRNGVWMALRYSFGGNLLRVNEGVVIIPKVEEKRYE